MNQPRVSAAADDVGPVAGEYYTGLVNHHDIGTCEVWLANAPESVLDQLQAMHPGVYVIHNDAPRSLKEIEEIRERIDPVALKDPGLTIHGNWPTQDGYLAVSVVRDAPGAQAKLDELFGPDVIRVVEQPLSEKAARRT